MRSPAQRQSNVPSHQRFRRGEVACILRGSGGQRFVEIDSSDTPTECLRLIDRRTKGLSTDTIGDVEQARRPCD